VRLRDKVRAEAYLYPGPLVSPPSRSVTVLRMRNGTSKAPFRLAPFAESVIHHSDHGCQYTSTAFGPRCREAGVRRSMGSVGDCFDNALCERYFATIECERLDRATFKTLVGAQVAVFDLIECLYSPHCRHASIDYLSPVDYERRHSSTPDNESGQAANRPPKRGSSSGSVRPGHALSVPSLSGAGISPTSPATRTPSVRSGRIGWDRRGVGHRRALRARTRRIGGGGRGDGCRCHLPF
jgi:hypothetical protein